MISDALRSDPHFDVVGTANNGKEGANKAQQLHPDVVVTDMMMPDYDGLYAVRNIMKNSPAPIILLSSLDRTNPEVFDALNEGAFDFIDKPQTKNSVEFKNALSVLKERIKAASTLDSGVLRKKVDRTNHHFHTFESVLQYHVLAIGASTGGPSAVESVLSQLPGNLPIPVVIAQHMPHRFLISYAERLRSLLPIPVQLARRNDVLKPGVIYIAPGDGNMSIRMDMDGRPAFFYSKRVYKEFNDPSVDCIFESVATCYGTKAIGVILTGMGRDGSQGLLKIKKSGGLTIAQDANSCVVHGMPKAAVEKGAVDYVVNLKEIPGFVMSCF